MGVVLIPIIFPEIYNFEEYRQQPSIDVAEKLENTLGLRFIFKTKNVRPPLKRSFVFTVRLTSMFYIPCCQIPQFRKF